MKVSPPVRIDTGAATRARAETSYLRRLEVCYKLMDIAIETHDEELERQVELMQERIWDAYSQRAERLPQPEVAAADHRADEGLHQVKGPRRSAEETLTGPSRKDRNTRTSQKELER